MGNYIERRLLKIAKKYQTKNDPSHGFYHMLHVLNLAKLIGNQENADFNILVPAAIFHNY